MGLHRDLHFALRMLRKNSLLLIVASLSLGLGIGARDTNPNSYADFLDMRANLRSVDALVAHALAMVNYERGGIPAVQFGAIVTSGYFELLETRASLGRVLQPSDFETDAPVVVVSDRFWRQELDGDAPARWIDGEVVPLPHLVPQVDADGNDIAGIHDPAPTMQSAAHR